MTSEGYFDVSPEKMMEYGLVWNGHSKNGKTDQYEAFIKTPKGKALKEGLGVFYRLMDKEVMDEALFYEWVSTMETQIIFEEQIQEKNKETPDDGTDAGQKAAPPAPSGKYELTVQVGILHGKIVKIEVERGTSTVGDVRKHIATLEEVEPKQVRLVAVGKRLPITTDPTKLEDLKLGKSRIICIISRSQAEKEKKVEE